MSNLRVISYNANKQNNTKKGNMKMLFYEGKAPEITNKKLSTMLLIAKIIHLKKGALF